MPKDTKAKGLLPKPFTTSDSDKPSTPDVQPEADTAPPDTPPAVTVEMPEAIERDDDIQVRFNDGKTTGFEDLSPHQLMERCCVALDCMAVKIADELRGDD